MAQIGTIIPKDTYKEANKRKRKSSSIGSPKYLPYLFVAPNMILFITFMIIPIFYTFYISLTKWNILGVPKFIGFDNYVNLASDKMFWLSIWNTVYYILGTVPLALAIALFLAILLNKNIRFKAFFRGILYAPAIISTVVVAMVWTWIFNADYGILNYILSLLGIPSINWFNNPKTAMIPIIVTTLWFRIGYNFVIYLSGLQNIPDMYYEASLIDGANKWQQFIHITFPLLKSTNVFVIVMAIIYGFKSFDLTYVMTRGGPAGATTTIVQYIYQTAFDLGKMGNASAVSIVLFILIGIFTFFQLRIGDDSI